MALGFADCGVDDPHHPEEMFEIYLVAQGESTAMVGGEAVLLQAGDLLAVDPGEVHTFVSSSEDICISWFRSRSSHVTSAARSRGSARRARRA